jgi:single-strand DNA-binding protein
MSSVNKVILVGNVGSDPEIKTFNNGGKVANFSLATTEKWRDKKTQEYVSKTEWSKISVFSEGLVSVIERYVKKGVKLYIEGRLQTRKWTDNSGNDKYITEVVLKGYGGTLVLLDGSNASADKPRLDVGGYNRNVVPGLDDEIPF